MKRFLIAAVLVLVPIVGAMQAIVPHVEADTGGVPSLHSVHVCGTPAHNLPSCAADVLVSSTGIPQASATPPAGSMGPTEFHSAYQLPCQVGSTVAQSVCAKPTTFGGQTIAIVVAYFDPNIESDLGVYNAQFGLPACTTANGCLTIRNLCQSSGHGKRAICGITDASWALEASMDVEVAHAVCQTCKILFVEANSNAWADLGAAENLAAQSGATEISNSWAGWEWNGETQYDTYWNHAGIATLFAAGDSAYGAEYPSVSPYVLSVGGTTLNINPDGTYASETAWASTGSGCSAYEPANSWEMSIGNWGSTGCANSRASGDISADADPTTGAAVYDSVPYNSVTGWWKVGGTSLATPLLAGVIALAGGAASYSNASQLPYVKLGGTNSHDIVSGSNGTCGTAMCAAGTGYDGPTGLGSPNGIGGL